MEHRVKAEIARRASIEAELEAWIRSHELGAEIFTTDLVKCFGGAVRSRLVQVRQKLAADGLAFVWNGKNGSAAAYQFRPIQLGRSAEVRPASQQELFR